LRPNFFGDKCPEKLSDFTVTRVKEKRIIMLKRKTKELVAFVEILAMVNQN
jgi:hypothetical protein